MAENNIDSDNI